MQSLFSFMNKAHAVANYAPTGVETIGNKIWFTYTNKSGSSVSAYYDIGERKFKSVVRGKQYGRTGYAVRNLVAREVIETSLTG